MSDQSVARRSVERSVERARKPEQASSPPVVDAKYAKLLADDLGCKVSTARTAFIGEPVSRALKVREWAFDKAPDSPERRARLIIGWARRRGAGAFRKDDDAEREIARRIAEYWRQHPEQLARTLREATNGAQS
jgi:hypothetical protein